MAITFDAWSDSAVLSWSNLSWTHTPVGTPRCVIVFVVQGGSGANQVSGVTYGGFALTPVRGHPNLKTTGEPGAVYAYVRKISIPAGAQTVEVAVTGASDRIAGCISLISPGDFEIVDDDLGFTINSDSLANPSGTLALAGASCFCAEAFFSGIKGTAGITPRAGWTSRLEYALANSSFGFYTYNTIGTQDVTFGWTQAADDAVCIALAVYQDGTAPIYKSLADTLGLSMAVSAMRQAFSAVDSATAGDALASSLAMGLAESAVSIGDAPTYLDMDVQRRALADSVTQMTDAVETRLVLVDNRRILMVEKPGPRVRLWTLPLEGEETMNRTIIRTASLPVEVRHPLFMKPRKQNPGGGGGGKVKLWGMFHYTWTQSLPSNFTTIACTRFTKGYNYALWDAAIRARIAARGGTPDDEISYWTAQDGGSESPSGQFVQLDGESVLDAASMCHIAVLGHSPPKEHLDAIRAKSAVGTYAMTGLHNVESCKQGTEWNAVIEIERLVSRVYVLAGKTTSGCDSDGLNAYGCTAIDKYEKRDSCGEWGKPDATSLCAGAAACGYDDEDPPNPLPIGYTPGSVACPHDAGRHAGLPANANVNSKHNWECDVRLGTYHSALTAAIQSKLATYYNPGSVYLVDGHVFDNHGNVYLGDSTLEFPDGYAGSAFSDGWKAFDLVFQNALASWPVRFRDLFYWANCSDSLGTYSTTDIKNRWSEFFFVKDGASARAWSGTGGIEEALERVESSGMRLVLGITGTHTGQNYWAITAGGVSPPVTGTWSQVVQKIADLGIEDSIYVQAIRQTSGGYGFWQEGFTPLA